MELKSLVSALKQLRYLTKSDNVLPLLEGQHLFIHELKQSEAESIRDQLVHVGFHAILSASARTQGKYTLMAHL